LHNQIYCFILNLESTLKSNFTPKSPKGDFLQITHFHALPPVCRQAGFRRLGGKTIEIVISTFRNELNNLNLKSMKTNNVNHKTIRCCLFIFILTLSGLIINITNIHAQIVIHTINVNNRNELADFFKYTDIRSPLISAHRGGGRIGFPENCIATFENTLQYTPSIFEIDPRLTKDSVIVLMHDEILERTTTGNGKLIDYTCEELQELFLKDKYGNITRNHIPLLADALEWCKGKTILVLDDKNVPYEKVTELVRKHNAFSNILMTVRSAEIASKLYELDNRFMFEAYIFNLKNFSEFESAGIPWSNVMIAYIGPKDLPENVELYKELNKRGVKAMVSGASNLDKLYLAGNTGVYKELFSHGSDIIESDLPVEVAIELNSLINTNSSINNYFGEKVIPLNEMQYLPGLMNQTK